MVDVIIKNVPEDCAEKVKEKSMVVVEKFLRDRDVKVTKEIQDKFETDVDTIRKVNGLSEKFKIVESEIV